MSDDLFEPMLLEGGLLSTSMGSIIGTGEGRGIGLLIIMAGMILFCLSIIFYIHFNWKDNNLETKNEFSISATEVVKDS